MDRSTSSLGFGVGIVKADALASRLRTGCPGKTNSKEQRFQNADEQTPTQLRQNQMIPAPISERRSMQRRSWSDLHLMGQRGPFGALSCDNCAH